MFKPNPHLYGEQHLRPAPGRLLLRLQGDLQVEDIIDDVLQDLHLADALVLGDARNQLLQPGVAVVHVAQSTSRLLHAGVFIPADGQALLGDAAHSFVAVPDWADGTDGLHDEDDGVWVWACADGWDLFPCLCGRASDLNPDSALHFGFIHLAPDDAHFHVQLPDWLERKAKAYSHWVE